MALTKVKGSGLATGAATESLVGIDDNATSTAITIDASENVGIGTTNPTGKLEVAANTNATEELARFGNNAGTNELIIEQSGSSGYTIKSSVDLRLHADYDNDTSAGGSNITMYTNGTEKLRINSAGNVGIGTSSPSADLEVFRSTNGEYFRAGVDNRGLQFTGSSSATFVGAVNNINAPSSQGEIAFSTTGIERVRVTGNGLTFNGDTAAANALDDYEEGTWTPVFGDATVAAGSDATYVKIGKTVWLWAEVTIQTAATNSGGGVVTGLPFISANNSVHERGVLTTNSVNYIANAHPWCYSYNGSASIGIYQSRATQGWVAINYSNCPTNSSLNLSISYQVP